MKIWNHFQNSVRSVTLFDNVFSSNLMLKLFSNFLAHYLLPFICIYPIYYTTNLWVFIQKITENLSALCFENYSYRTNFLLYMCVLDSDSYHNSKTNYFTKCTQVEICSIYKMKRLLDCGVSSFRTSWWNIM